MAERDTDATDGKLKGRVVLITGGRRVGADLALMLAARGANVAMTYHTSRAAIEQTIARAEASGSKGLAIAADLTRPDQAETRRPASRRPLRPARLPRQYDQRLQRARRSAIITAQDFDAMIAANLAAPFHTALASARAMLTQPAHDGIKGKIVIIGDWATERPYKDYLPYLVAKGGLTTMTLALARELAPHVSVALIQPAMIDPPPDFTEADKQAIRRANATAPNRSPQRTSTG